MSALTRIKELVFADRVIFTKKAELEIERDGLTHELVKQAILNAPAINKTIRSRSPNRTQRETLYVIAGITYAGIIIYTKGKILKKGSKEYYYVIISSKRDVEDIWSS